MEISVIKRFVSSLGIWKYFRQNTVMKLRFVSIVFVQQEECPRYDMPDISEIN